MARIFLDLVSGSRESVYARAAGVGLSTPRRGVRAYVIVTNPTRAWACDPSGALSTCAPRPHPADRHHSSQCFGARAPACASRSEEHTSELQSRLHLVCRLLLEK